MASKTYELSKDIFEHIRRLKAQKKGLDRLPETLTQSDITSDVIEPIGISNTDYGFTIHFRDWNDGGASKKSSRWNLKSYKNQFNVYIELLQRRAKKPLAVQKLPVSTDIKTVAKLVQDITEMINSGAHMMPEISEILFPAASAPAPAPPAAPQEEEEEVIVQKRKRKPHEPPKEPKEPEELPLDRLIDFEKLETPKKKKPKQTGELVQSPFNIMTGQWEAPDAPMPLLFGDADMPPLLPDVREKLQEEHTLERIHSIIESPVLLEQLRLFMLAEYQVELEHRDAIEMASLIPVIRNPPPDAPPKMVTAVHSFLLALKDYVKHPPTNVDPRILQMDRKLVAYLPKIKVESAASSSAAPQIEEEEEEEEPFYTKLFKKAPQKRPRTKTFEEQIEEDVDPEFYTQQTKKTRAQKKKEKELKARAEYSEDRLKHMVTPEKLAEFNAAIDKALEEEGTVKVFDEKGNVILTAQSRPAALAGLRKLVDEDYANGTHRVAKVGSKFAVVEMGQTADGRPMLYGEVLSLLSNLNMKKEDDRRIAYKIKDMMTRGVKSTDIIALAKDMLEKKLPSEDMSRSGNPKLKNRKITKKNLAQYNAFLSR